MRISPPTGVRALYLILGGHFVDLARKRRTESEIATAELGIKAHYGELPDGRLDGYHRRYYRHIMGITLVSLAHKYDITAFATLGEAGYCGHFDHIATHEAALEACNVLQANGRDITLYELTNDHSGDLRVPVDSTHKLSALALHSSQGGFGPKFWQQHPAYVPLLDQETYTVS